MVCNSVLDEKNGQKNFGVHNLEGTVLRGRSAIFVHEMKPGVGSEERLTDGKSGANAGDLFKK